MKYDEIRDSLRTFDIVVCDHKQFFWQLVGHTAMLVKDEEKDTLFIWQSTTKYAGVSGTSLSFMNEWLTTYPGKVFVRRMSIPSERRTIAELFLDDYIRTYRGKPYPDIKSFQGIRYMLNQVLDWPPLPVFENNTVQDARDCSDRVGDTLKYCGLLDVGCNTAELEPDNFRERMIFHKSIDRYLVNGVLLGVEEQIK